MGYSKEAAKNILLLGKKDYVKNIEANETLNKAFASKYFIEDDRERL